MSHLNILTISKEIDNLNKNILQFRGQIDHLESENNTLNNNIKNIGAVTFESVAAYEEKLWSHDKKIKKTSNYNFAYEESFFGDRDFKKYYRSKYTSSKGIRKRSP